MQYC
jgi:eukaryotic translation initiation factor 2-alpha kinase 4